MLFALSLFCVLHVRVLYRTENALALIPDFHCNATYVGIDGGTGMVGRSRTRLNMTGMHRYRRNMPSVHPCDVQHRMFLMAFGKTNLLQVGKRSQVKPVQPKRGSSFARVFDCLASDDAKLKIFST